MSSLLHLISTTLLSLCHQQQLPEKDVHVQGGSNPAAVSTLHSQGHWLQSWERPLNSNVIAWWHWGCPSVSGKSSHYLALSQFHRVLRSLLPPKEKYHDDFWHFPFPSYSLSQQWCGNLWSSDGTRSQSKPALHPEGHSHSSFGTGGLVCFATTPSP